MKPYGRNLRYIEEHQYSDFHTGMVMPQKGMKRGQKRKRYLRLFKKMERANTKSAVRKYLTGNEDECL